MFITSNINFDNTLSVKKFAETQEAKNILNDNFHGSEKQLYKVGDLVNGNEHGFNTGKIIDVYKNNGFFCYVIEYKIKPKARKIFKMTLRQKDIKKIWDLKQCRTKRKETTDKTKKQKQAKKMEEFFMYTTSKKITNTDAKNIISGEDIILVDDSSINAYTDSTNYYNAGVYGWNYSIGYNARLDKYVICGYRIPQSVLNAANSVTRMS